MGESKEVRLQEHDYRVRILNIIRSESNDDQIKTLLQEYHEHDIAGILETLTADERERLRKSLGNELMSDVVAFMDNAGKYLSEMNAHDAAELIGKMDADDALEALEHVDEQTRSKILELIEEDEIKQDIALIDSYEDTEFGSRMSTNFIAVKRNQTVKETMKSLVREAARNDNIFTIFVLNEDDSFYGVIDLKDLIVARSHVELESLICNTFPFVYDKDIISENIERLRSYSENMIPVISSSDNTFLGVITANDIIELID